MHLVQYLVGVGEKKEISFVSLIYDSGINPRQICCFTMFNTVGVLYVTNKTFGLNEDSLKQRSIISLINVFVDVSTKFSLAKQFKLIHGYRSSDTVLMDCKTGFDEGIPISILLLSPLINFYSFNNGYRLSYV